MTLESMSDEEILHIANPIMDNLMDASTAIDHERHIQDFTSRGGSLLPCSNVLAQWRLSGSSGSIKRLVNSSPKCSSSKRMAHSWSIT